MYDSHVTYDGQAFGDRQLTEKQGAFLGGFSCLRDDG